MSARAAVLLVAALTLAVVAALVTWRVVSDDVVEAGEVVALGGDVGAADADYAVGRRVELRVPTGTVVVRVGDPVDELRDGTRAAEGAVLVPVQWELDPWVVQIPGTGGAVGEEVRLAVRPGDDDPVRLDPDRRAAAVAVARDDARDVSLTLTFAGATQTAGPDGEVDAGVAQALYDTDPPSAPPAVVDGSTRAAAGAAPAGVSVAGRVTAVAVHQGPWTPGDGWVPEPGQTWCSVDVTTLLPRLVRGPRGGYRVRDPGPDVRLDGVEPASSLLRTDPADPVTDGLGSGLLTWLVGNGGGRLEVRHDVTLVPRRGGPSVPVTITASLPADAVCPQDLR